MENINALTRLVFWLLLCVAAAVVISRYANTLISVLLAALFMLVIARLLWPSRRR
jgi:uncharacterized membrane protein YoaK (UPF0700 family)